MKTKPVLESQAAILVAQAGCQHAAGKDWAISICVVDDGGHILVLHRMDGAAPGTVQAAIDKARSAAIFRAPTMLFQGLIADGQTSILALPGAMPIQGGLPIRAGEVVVGGVGVSGVRSHEDEEIAAMALESPSVQDFQISGPPMP